MPIHPPDDALLTRAETAAALTLAGFPIARSTLATMAARLNGPPGPPYLVFGRTAIYPWQTTLAWAQGRLARPRSKAFVLAAETRTA